MSKKIIAIIVFIGIAIIGFFYIRSEFLDNRVTQIPSLPVSQIIQQETSDDLAQTEADSPNFIPDDTPDQVLIAENLEIPWSMEFLPTGNIILTERPGKVRLIDAETGLLNNPILTIDEVEHIGEGGLLGVALDPNFREENWVYFYYTYRLDNQIYNKVVRYQYIEPSSFQNMETVIDQIPGARTHNGGRIKFGPDEKLYITTGDAQNTSLSQNLDSTAGKILRINKNGSIPNDNPFPNSPVYSSGHRNPQGLDWDANDQLWATEHGPSAQDELNKIEPGKNYGWPTITGTQTSANMESPILQSGSTTWAPSGMAITQNNMLIFGGLRGRTLYTVNLDEPELQLQSNFIGEYGRIRDVYINSGYAFIFTNNTDGRGIPTGADDILVGIKLSTLE